MSAPASSSGARAPSAAVASSSSSAEATRTESGEATSSSSATAAASTGRRPDRPDRTLDDVMRAPSSTLPDVVVLESMPEGLNRKELLDPKEDLWLSTADGRFSSPVIPLNVGEAPYIETFHVHKNILLKSEYFQKALCGDFRESRTQSLDLPEENPAIFHFLIAYLYEGKYNPIKPASSVLVPDDKGKGKEGSQDTGAESDSDESVESYGSDISAVSRRRRERRRRREDRHYERMRQKRPGVHRPNCGCPQCLSTSGPPCWHCQAPRAMPPPAPIPHHPGVVIDHRDIHAQTRVDRPRRQQRRRHGVPAPPPMTPPAPAGWSSDSSSTARISGEDLRTWLLAYELNIDVYIMANKFLLEGFKTEIARATIDMLEIAGADAAVSQVLFLCRKLYEGLPENDNLLKMIFARVGFLQPWRHSPEETKDFLVNHPEIAPLLLREMAARREEDMNGKQLPSMERPWFPVMDPISPYHRAPHYHPYRGPPRW
ncbi:hypothetical protein B0T16DRAFT_452269 [Cercophora newfieldiana]|uniref:BTB domain-containing protein n=1 Tax=Cercophora newfieldiana TaxID=92897 RepID=A0AA40D1G2_9PEZI|nr:hypothetical protein B0T16DRAFT_452269 [Cercophora newfieldiana]